jgi:hypothetical protein
VCCDADARLDWGWRYVVEEVLKLCGGMERREKAFEAGPNIFAQALLTRLFTALVGLASLARMSHFEMSAGLCSPKQTPSLRTNQGSLLHDACSLCVQSQICPTKGLAIGVLRGGASNRELPIQAGRAPAAARNPAMQPEIIIATGVRGALRVSASN